MDRRPGEAQPRGIKRSQIRTPFLPGPRNYQRIINPNQPGCRNTTGAAGLVIFQSCRRLRGLRWFLPARAGREQTCQSCSGLALGVADGCHRCQQHIPPQAAQTFQPEALLTAARGGPGGLSTDHLHDGFYARSAPGQPRQLLSLGIEYLLYDDRGPRDVAVQLVIEPGDAAGLEPGCRGAAQLRAQAGTASFGPCLFD